MVSGPTSKWLSLNSEHIADPPQDIQMLNKLGKSKKAIFARLYDQSDIYLHPEPLTKLCYVRDLVTKKQGKPSQIILYPFDLQN